MNMAKLGIVAQSKFGQAKGANPRKHKAGDVMRYTLCVYQGQAKRNSFRSSFIPFRCVYQGVVRRRAARHTLLVNMFVFSY